MHLKALAGSFATLALAACAAATVPGGTESGAPVRLVNAQGENVGSAVLTSADGGVRINVSVTGLTPGAHGIHIHEQGACEPPDFSSAGGHFSPVGRQHGLENPQGPHAGDLPNLMVGADGRGQAEFVNERVTLGEGPRSLFREGGTALVIHAEADDQRTDPSGNSGDRVACGVIAPRG